MSDQNLPPQAPQYSQAPYGPPPKRPNWFARHKWLTGIGVGLVAIAALASGTSGEETDSSSGPDQVGEGISAGVDAGLDTKESEPSKKDKPEKSEAPQKKEAAEPEPVETVSQQNARESAQDYLDFSGFSRTGLIEQLEFEGFSTEDATYGVDALAVDWKEQAALVARDYLDYSSFSRSGLIEQLRFEGFSRKQAEYGVSQVGL